MAVAVKLNVPWLRELCSATYFTSSDVRWIVFQWMPPSSAMMVLASMSGRVERTISSRCICRGIVSVMDHGWSDIGEETLFEGELVEPGEKSECLLTGHAG